MFDGAGAQLNEIVVAPAGLHTATGLRMRILVSLLLVLAGACLPEDDDDELDLYCGDGVVSGEETCDDGNRDDSDACPNSCGLDIPLTVSWRITNLAGDFVSCTPESDTAKIRVQPYVSGAPGGPEESFIAPCTSGGVSVQPAPADEYRVIVEIEWAPTRRLYAASLPIRVDASSGSLAHAVIYSDAGYAGLQWTLRDSGGSEVGCGTGVGAIDSITATYTASAGPTMITQQLACAPGLATSQPLPPGVYTIELSARGSSATVSGVQINERNVLTEAPPVVITLP